MLRFLLLSLPCLGYSLFAFAQRNRIVVDADRVINRIPATIYGSCMEDVNHEIYGGLYDQKIMGESFEEPSSGVNYEDWKKFSGYWAADREYSDGSISIVPGRHTRRVVAKNEIGVEPDEHAKLIYNAMSISDGTIEADMKFLQARGEGGSILVRVSDPGVGDNVFNGYEIRLCREDNKIKLIKHRNNYQLLTEYPVSFAPDQWHHLKITFTGAHIQVYLNQSANPALEYTDTAAPLLQGKIGLRTAGAPLSFKNISLTTGGKTTMLPLIYPAYQQISDRWDMVQGDAVDARFTLVQQGAFNGITTQAIEFVSGKGRAGIANCSLNRWDIAVEKGQTFTGSCYLRYEGSPTPVTVALESADGSRVYAQQTIPTTATTWKNYAFSLTSNAPDTNARFVLYIQDKGKLYVDQVMLFSSPDKQFRGLPLRADIGNAIVAEGLSFMRYAGTMVNAGGYRFKKMIGDRGTRPPYTGHWNEYSTNGFGIEDFVQFCEAARFTPAFAINIEEAEADAADMVEYLNGDTSTEWGKKRAANGHPKPYEIRYIEIGNEEVIFEGDNAKGYDHYIERFTRLYKAMHAKDTSIQFVCAAWWRPESANMEKVFKALNGKAAYWDYHPWADEKNAGVSVDKELTRMQQLFHRWDAATTMQCAIFEENGALHNMQRALGHATILNAVRRHGDFLLTSCPANALQPYLQNDNSWDQGQIFFTPTQVWGMPPFYAQQMAARNHLPLRVQETVAGSLDVTATESEDGRVLVLHVVNTDTVAQTASLILNHFTSRKKEVRVWTLAGSPEAENVPANTTQVTAKESTVAAPVNGSMQYHFPANSYTILRFE